MCKKTARIGQVNHEIYISFLFCWFNAAFFNGQTIWRHATTVLTSLYQPIKSTVSVNVCLFDTFLLLSSLLSSLCYGILCCVTITRFSYHCLCIQMCVCVWSKLNLPVILFSSPLPTKCYYLVLTEFLFLSLSLFIVYVLFFCELCSSFYVKCFIWC